MYANPPEGDPGGEATIYTDMGNEGQGCMTFYFSLWHEGGIKALKIRTEDPDGYIQYIWDLTDWSMESNNEWWIGSVNFLTHKLVFEALHSMGNSTSGYVAIDDVAFDLSQEAENCEVLPPEAMVRPTTAQPSTTTPSSSEPHFCNFNEGLCGWTIDSGLNDTDQFLFTVTRGEDQDGITGPMHDHDTTTDNAFLWASAASGNPDTETALASPEYSTTRSLCFTFWFDLTVSSLQVL